FTCENKVIVSSSFTGKNSDVQVGTLACSNIIAKRNQLSHARQISALVPVRCVQCSCLPDLSKLFHRIQSATNCFIPFRGGPNLYDRQVISGALLYDRAFFNIAIGFTIYMQYSTCQTFFVNRASYNET
ncbi:uncharacterized protein BJ212DRAFT_1278022, partial [Suillus subaureus]